MTEPSSLILVFSSFWPVESNRITGIFVVQQTEALARLGNRLLVVVPTAAGRKTRLLHPGELGLPETVTLRELPLPRLPQRLSGHPLAFRLNTRLASLGASAAMRDILRRHGTPAGCILHGFHHLAASLPDWHHRIGARKLLFLHGIDHNLMRLGGAFLRGVTARAGQALDTVALVGSPLRQYATGIGFPADKLVIVHNGTVLPEPRSLPGRQARGTCSILSISNLLPLKGIADNLRALAILAGEHGVRDWSYTIIGDGPQRAELQELARTLGLLDRVHFRGRLSYEETMEELARCDIFSLPSWGDAFGIVYLEAMARGKPAIGCRGSGAQEIVTDRRDGILVPAKDPRALARELKRLIEEPELRHSLGTAALRTAERFTWEANARRVLDLLEIAAP